MKKPKSKYSMRPNGMTELEQWYSLSRRNCAIIATRQKERSRCKHCFSMRYYPKDACRQAPARGCDGCAEMETFFHEAEQFFKNLSANKGGKE